MTHSARRFDQDKENDHVTNTDGIEPGLTLRDIRFAVILENVLDSPNNIARVPNYRENRSTFRAVEWKSLLSKYPFLEPRYSSLSDIVGIHSKT